MHFLKQFVQTAPHNGLPAKTCNLLKILSLSLKIIYLFQITCQCDQNGKLLCHCGATDSHPHHNRYLPLQCSTERIFLMSYLNIWLAIINLPPPCSVELQNWVKEWGIGWDEFHQHPIVGRKPLLDGVWVMETHIIPNSPNFGKSSRIRPLSSSWIRSL